MRTRNTFIQAVSAYVPERVDVSHAVEQGRYAADDVERHQLTGAVVAGDTPAPELALRAAQEAVKRCDQRPDELDLLLYADTWHQGPEGWLPTSYLQHHLTGGEVPAIEIRHGCSGVFGGMLLAASYLDASADRRSALVVSADNFGTPLVDRWSSGPFLLGDAGTAVILGKRPGFARLKSVCTTTVLDEMELRRGGRPLFPPDVTVGRGINFNARRAEVAADPVQRAKAAARMLRLHQRFGELVTQTLDESDISAADITRMAIVHTRREIVEDRGMSLIGVDFSRSTWDYGRTVGHCGASDQLMGFDHLLSTGQLNPGDHFMMLATGPGIVLSCAVIEILHRPTWTG